MHMTGKTISQFHALLKEPCSELTERAIDKGAIPIGYTCSYVPEVLLSIDSLVPIRVRAPGVSGTEVADIYLSSVVCSYTRSLLEFAMDDRYTFLKGWVFAAGCDHLRRLYDNMDYLMKPECIHIIDVPHRSGPHQLAWYTEELKRLTESLSSHFGVTYTNGTVGEAVERHNAFSDLLLSIGELRKGPNPLISGTEFHALMLASQVVPKALFVDTVKAFKEQLQERGGIGGYRARLVIVGGQLDDPGYIEVIESTGGLIVADILCTGSIPGLNTIAVTDDPIGSIAHHYLNKISCPRMMEAFDARVETILRSVEAYNADGVIIEYVKFCDTWGIEASLLASTVRKQGVPTLCLEREYRLTGEGQLRTRVQAFIESMGK